MGTRGTVVVAAISMALAANAKADDETAKNEQPPPTNLERTFGFGTILGGGFTVATLTTSTGSSSSGLNGAILLPTIELEGFLTPTVSIDFSMPLTNIIIASVFVRGVVLSAQAIVQVSVGEGDVRGVFGAGLGGDFLSAGSVSGGGVQFPGVVALQVLSRGRGFGFELLARPYIEVGGVGGGGGSYVGGAVLFGIGFFGYMTRDKH